jgi:hypothetical protein
MATIQEVNSSIMFGDFTNDQLNSIISAIKFRRSQLTKTAKRSFLVGSQVKFYSPKRNQIVFGTIEKMAVKYATINTNQGRWRVPANMLEAV